MEKNKKLASCDRVLPVFSARMLPSISLKITPHVEKYIETRLTPTYEEDPVSYRDFIAQWGTHFFHKADFGGVIRVIRVDHDIKLAMISEGYKLKIALAPANKMTLCVFSCFG